MTPTRWAALLGAAFVYYAWLIAGPGFALFAPVLRGTVFQSMLSHLLAGKFDIDPGVIGNEGFLRDGRVYAYFGIVPALLRLPLAAFPTLFDTDVTRLSCALAAALTSVYQLRLLALVAAHAPTQRAVLLALAAGVLIGGPQVQFLNASIYQEVLSWALVFAAGFVFAAVQGLLEAPGFNRPIMLRLALFAGLALLTRSSTGTGLALAFTLIWLVQLRRSRHVTAALTLAALAALCGGINVARWGDPFTFVDVRLHLMNTEFPDRLARLPATGLFSLNRLWFGLQYYLLPIWSIPLPDGTMVFEKTQAWLVEAELPPGSMLLSDPLLLALSAWFVLARWWRLALDRLAMAGTFIGLALPAGAILVFAFMDFRYRMEFYPLMTFCAALALTGDPTPQPGWLGKIPLSIMTITGIVSAHMFLWWYQIAPFGPADYPHLFFFWKHVLTGG